MDRRFRYDMPQNYYFGGGGITYAPIQAICALVVVVLLILIVRRRNLLPVFVIGSTLLPYGVTFAIASVNFPVLRVLVVATFLRLFVRGEAKLGSFTTIDKIFVGWALSNAIIFSILWNSSAALVNRLGVLLTTLGPYFIARILIRDKSDMLILLRTLACITIVVSVPMAIEHLTRYNLFSLLGAPALSEIRIGSIRAQGPFGHSIIAGTIGAMLILLFVGACWVERKWRILFLCAIPASIIMALSSASSTPVMTIGAGILGLCMWPLRKHMRAVRWTIVAFIVSMQVVMKAPVWFLINHVSNVLGGSGYHRAMLIDVFVRHFSDWWLIGTRNNASWGYDMWDVDNAYVGAGLGGGLLTFLLFIALFVVIFSRIGKSLKLTKGKRSNEHFIWAIGACIFANVVGFFGIVYFDQSVLIWYAVLALVVATPQVAAEKTAPALQAAKETRRKSNGWRTVEQEPALYSGWGNR